MRRVLFALIVAFIVPSSAMASSVQVRNSAYGPVLFSGSGRALYLFTADGTRRSTCYGGCARAWPPFYAKGRAARSGGARRGLLGTTRRRNGRRQVTYAGHPCTSTSATPWARSAARTCSSSAGRGSWCHRTAAPCGSANVTPVSSSETSHSRRAASSFFAAPDMPTRCGCPRCSSRPSGPDVGRAGHVLGGRVQRRQRAHRGRLRDDVVEQAHDLVLDRLGVRLQARRGIAGVRGDAAQVGARGVEPALQLHHEQQVGELRLPVGHPALVVALGLEVAEVDAADAVRAARRS